MIPRSSKRRSAVGLVVAIGAVFAVVVLAQAPQSVLMQLGLTEIAARNHIFRVIEQHQLLGFHDPLVTTGRAAFRKVPAAARAQAATALFAWARAYGSSSAFKTAYAARRAATEPQRRVYARSVDEEVKNQWDEHLQAIASMRQMMASMPADQRAGMEKTIKDTEAKSVELQKAIRSGIEGDRAKERASEDEVLKRWQQQYPADPQVIVARHLREFLAATADVDYTAKLTNLMPWGGGEAFEFDGPAYRTKPWQWVEAVLVGKDTVTAARTAAEAWLKEIGSTP